MRAKVTITFLVEADVDLDEVTSSVANWLEYGETSAVFGEDVDLLEASFDWDPEEVLG